MDRSIFAKKKLPVFFLHLFLAIMQNSRDSFAHGMDKKGPHGGYIQMPGAFHTELVLKGDSAFDVYLIDANFKNPTVKNSSIEVNLKTEKGENHLDCSAKEDRFVCKLPEGNSVKESGKIIIRAIRMKSERGISMYTLPLTLQ